VNWTKEELWSRFQKHYAEFPSLGLAVDLSRTRVDEAYLESMAEPLESAFANMAQLEAGAVANPDEKRMVGHYWLRNPALAPDPAIRQAIIQTHADIRKFVREVHTGFVSGENGKYQHVLVVGIGGSALGPQFVSHALGQPASDPMRVWFLDNTDPDGMDKVLSALGAGLAKTLILVISKSGGTKETRNGMLEVRAACQRAGLSFERSAVAITGEGSALDQLAIADRWLRRFPMWDWVGGRTSVTSAVGLLPAALQGIDIEAFIAGADACDAQTRVPSLASNPAAQLALAWHAIGGGRGARDMVILPYKDRLELFSKYLQQLIMESIGKELDLDGNVVNQGIAVYGNKGATDQHAYIQQLRDGLNNFFVTFIEVLEDRAAPSIEVEPGITSGDYLLGFLLGTRQALAENGRESITLTVERVDAFRVGVLIALYERAVGLYASLVNINAYHQPGVEAGKKAATAVLKLQEAVVGQLSKNAGNPKTALEIATALGQPTQAEPVFKICRHLAANARVTATPGDRPLDARFSA